MYYTSQWATRFQSYCLGNQVSFTSPKTVLFEGEGQVMLKADTRQMLVYWDLFALVVHYWDLVNLAEKLLTVPVD